MPAKKPLLTPWLIGGLVLLVAGGILLWMWGVPLTKSSGAAVYPGGAYPAMGQDAVAYPFIGSASITSYLSATPAPPGVRFGSPTVRLSPTAANGAPAPRWNGLFVTPLPNEKIQVGQPALISRPSDYPLPETPTVARPYTIRNQWIGTGASRNLVLFVRDSKTGIETQLGNPEGSAEFGTGNDQYIIWKSGCNGCSVLPTGLYAHLLQTGTETRFATQSFGNGYPRLEGAWVVYADREQDGPTRLTLALHAHNLLNGEDILISSDVVSAFGANMGGFVNDFYLLQGGRVAWIIWSGMSIYDLAQHAQRTLTVPKPRRAPRHWTISGDVMLWQDEFYQGYDLRRDAYFSIPIIPPGWENKVILNVGPVKAIGDNLYWSLETEGQMYYFSAPLIAKDQAETISGQETPTPKMFFVSTSPP
jgi:hypothetical protein